MHVTRTQLQEYTDRLLDERRLREIEIHLEDCQQCRAALESFRRLESFIKKIPLDEVSKNFTRRVMEAVGVRDSWSFARQLFLNLLPLAFIALTVLIVIVFTNGTSPTTLTQQESGYLQTLAERTNAIVSTGVATILAWTEKLSGVSTSIPFLKLAAGLMLAFALVVLFDEFVFLPMMKKKG